MSETRTDPTEFRRKKLRAGPCGSGRARVVEFSYYSTVRQALKRSIRSKVSSIRSAIFQQIITPPPYRGAQYCDEHVCLFVCLSVRDHIFGTTRPIFTKCFVRVTYGRGSVLLWRRSDKLRISGFMDDVIFAHKLRLLDVAARLSQWGSHAALGLARRSTRCRQRTLGATSYSQGPLGRSGRVEYYITTSFAHNLPAYV